MNDSAESSRLSKAESEELEIVSREALPISATPVPSPIPSPPSPKAKGKKLTLEQLATADAMFLGGAPASDIAAHFEVADAYIASRARRLRLSEQRNRMKAAAEVLGRPQSNATLAAKRAKFINDMAEVVEQGAEVLKQQKPLNRKQVREHFQAASAVMEVAKPILGIEDAGDGGSRPITLQFLATPSEFARPVSGSDATVEATA